MSRAQPDAAIELAGRVGDLLAREAPELSATQVMRLAILVARDTAGLSPDIARTALMVVERGGQASSRAVGTAVIRALYTAHEMQELPVELRSAARIYGSELAFAADDARRAIDWLASSRLAVIHVELWSPAETGESIQWLGNSGYEERCEKSSWDAYVGCCARGARAFVDEWERSAGEYFGLGERGVVFHLWWHSQAEAARGERARRRRQHE